MFTDHADSLPRNRDRSDVVAGQGMVCTSQPLASMAGIDVLKAGGNAVDAAVAANAVLSVVEPMSCGPGGDLFAIVWIEKDRKLYGLNASGRAPYEWNLKEAASLGLDRIPTVGPLSWSVPGCVTGWEALLERFGSRSPADSVQPAIRIAADGFPVSPIIARAWNTVEFEKHPTLAETYAPGGKPPKFGDIFRNRQIAEFYAKLAVEGCDVFYRGEFAERIVAFSKKNGGRFTRRDFEEHSVDWIDPVSTPYRGYDVWELPPNGQGIAVLQIMNILERFDLGSLRPNSAEHLHLFIETVKLVFEDRARYYADPGFASVPVDYLISKEYAEKRAALIYPNRAATSLSPGTIPSGPDTVYLTAADADGNMISLIQSIYRGFGSLMVPDRLGFALQNRGAMFSLDPNHPNRLEPHKRPFNTIIPGFVTENGAPLFSFGVMGGDFQPQGQAQILTNIIDFGLSPRQAGEQPRVSLVEHASPMGDKARNGGRVDLEPGIDDEVRQKLTDMGHRVTSEGKAYGGYQGIWRIDEPRRYFGGSDPRKDGCAMRY
jgi:gamma-glutamyltranspeptidase/glutathione hydrolase